jgi:hypothetical protein
MKHFLNHTITATVDLCTVHVLHFVSVFSGVALRMVFS